MKSELISIEKTADMLDISYHDIKNGLFPKPNFKIGKFSYCKVDTVWEYL